MKPRPPSVAPDGRELRPRAISLLRSPCDHHDRAYDVVVGVTLYNQAESLGRCLRSIAWQEVGRLRVAVVLLDDISTDNWVEQLDRCDAPFPFYVLRAECGSAAQARNALLDWVDVNLPKAHWIARLDADDRFADPASLREAVLLGNATHAKYVVGSNRLVRDGRVLNRTNIATDRLRDAEFLVPLLEQMAEGTADNELPSCNLLLRNHCGWRYPSIGSAEDHWLVSSLLIHEPTRAAILSESFYCDYSLDGQSTTNAHRQEVYYRQRRYISSAAHAWHDVRQSGRKILGWGQEGIVSRIGGEIQKRFYPGIIDEGTVKRLKDSLKGVAPHLPAPHWVWSGDHWVASYTSELSSAVETISEEEAQAFLRRCLEARLVCSNIKRTNLRRLPHGGLVFVDIGKSVVPMSASYFMDSAARLYAISVLGWPDEELTRRRPRRSPPNGSLDWLPGFNDFFGRLMTCHAVSNWESVTSPAEREYREPLSEVTLLIKACGMDAEYLTSQVTHIVHNLSRPRSFAKRVLLLDSFSGPFLRQYADCDWESVVAQAHRLVEGKVIDEVLIAPQQAAEVREINRGWFELECTESHSLGMVPVSSQLWAFDQIKTRYVLQCDVDTLVGRRDLNHDYLFDMMTAVSEPDVLGVAFNIPHAEGSQFRSYDAPKGEFVPEVRCGLLDLNRLREMRPLPNSLESGKLRHSWYRSTQEQQRRRGLRTLRGGDPRTFYVHPPNAWKADAGALARVRDLVGQGRVPKLQHGHWDLAGTDKDWRYPHRDETIVMLCKGRNTPNVRLRRWLSSLLMQDDQDFGVIIIDDSSEVGFATELPDLIRPLGDRVTLVRHQSPQGRIPNFRLASRSICRNPDSLLCVLDLDDALFSPAVVKLLKEKYAEGADFCWGMMFRPDKPLKLYQPCSRDVHRPCAGDVWVHLRAFRKRLFDMVPDDALKFDGQWISECTDYATMVPMAGMCRQPSVIDEYLYYHERSTPSNECDRQRKDAVIRRIVSQALIQSDLQWESRSG